MPEMSPEQAAMMEQQAGGQQGPGAGAGGGGPDPIKLIQDAGQSLSQISDLINGAPGATDEDREQMAQIMSMFADLVERKMASAEGGESVPAPGGGRGAVPAEAGAGGVPMGPNTRM